MSVAATSTKQRVGLTERLLRRAGALPDSCTEQVSRVCLECGTTVADIASWQAAGQRCEACDGTEFRGECVRCRGTCVALSGGRHRPCVSVAVFRGTGRVAFPERVGEPPAEPAPAPAGRPTPPGASLDDPWITAGRYLGTIVGTAAGLCRRWLDGLGIR